MSSKYIKLPSLQGGEVKNNSLLDFDIPDYGYYNLSKSYVSLMSTAETVEQVSANIVGVHAVEVKSDLDMPYKNNVYVGDYDIRTDKMGSIDNLQTSNVLNCNMDVFSRDFEHMFADNYKTMTSTRDASYTSDKLQLKSNFRILDKSASSAEIPFELKIPLSSFSSFCNTQIYSAQDMGRTRVHLQLKTDKITVNERLCYPNPYISYECVDLAADRPRTGITTKNYGNTLNNIAPQDTILVSGDVTDGDAFNLAVVVNAIAANGQGWNITLANNLPDGAITGISFVKVQTFQECNNQSGTEQNTTFSWLQSTNPVDLHDYRKYVGRSVRIIGDNLRKLNGDAVPFVDTMLASVDLVDAGDQGNNAQVYFNFTDSYRVNDGETANNIVLFIQGVELEPPTFENITADANDTHITELNCNNLMLNELCLWVNKKVAIHCLQNGVRVVENALIKSLTQKTAVSATTGLPLVGVELDRTVITLQDTQVASLIAIQDIPADPAKVNLVYKNPNLVLQQLTPQHRLVKNMGSQIIYPKFTVEKVNIPTGTISFNRLFDVEPMVRNAYVMITTTTGLMSYPDTLKSYRWRVNNVDKTNRDIDINTSLEKDNIIQVMTTSSKPLRNMKKLFGSEEITIPMCSLPVGIQKSVQLTLNFNEALGNDLLVYLFKESQAQV